MQTRQRHPRTHAPREVLLRVEGCAGVSQVSLLDECLLRCQASLSMHSSFIRGPERSQPRQWFRDHVSDLAIAGCNNRRAASKRDPGKTHKFLVAYSLEELNYQFDP